MFSSCQEALVSDGSEDLDLRPEYVLTPRSSNDQSSTTISTEWIVLGEKRNNPYEIGVVNAAIQSLYGASEPLKTPTHRYIKTTLASQAEFANLIEWAENEDVELWDFPLEYEILVEGQQYREEGLSEGQITPHYAVVPVEKNLPETGTYELVDELYLDDSNPYIFVETYKVTGNTDQIESDIIGDGIPLSEIDGTPPPDGPGIPSCESGCFPTLVVDPSTPEFNLIWVCLCDEEEDDDGGGIEPPLETGCGCPISNNRRFAAGCVQVQNDRRGPKDVWNVKVIVRNNFFTARYTYSDRNGCWSINERHRGNVNVRFKFENSNVNVKNTAYNLALSAVRDNRPQLRNPPYNDQYVFYNDNADNTSIERRYWAAAHTVTTIEEYRENAGAEGVPLTNKKLNWFTLPNDGAASAPMLRNIPFSSWPDLALYWGITRITPLNILRNLSIPFRPDVINPYEAEESAAEYNATMMHELGHTSHYSNVGELYWFQLRNHIIVNRGYGSPGNFWPGSNSGHAAFAEALGFYSGARFGGDRDGGKFNRFIDNYIPSGLCWDLEDNSPGENLRGVDGDGFPDPSSMIIANDNVQGFTPEMFLLEANNGVNSIQDFGDALRDNQLQNTSSTTVNFDALINYWDAL